MKIWCFDRFSFVLSFFFFFFFSFFMCVLSWGLSGGLIHVGGLFSLYCSFDVVSVYMVLLTVILALCVIFISPWLSFSSFVALMLSQALSLLCYVCCHALFFWMFYEGSIMVLLYLLLKDSPYSERYTAFWYFLGYLVFSSLPMLVLILYFSYISGGFSLCLWGTLSEDKFGLVLLAVLFMTKIPLFPFHSWLPVVHAEASSVVSVCLSGYIMKLGVLGIFRFCSWIVGDGLFFSEHVCLVMLFSLFFMVCASFELDCKRWLAFLSLSHISLVPFCLCVSSNNNFGVAFCYCLGHGLAASVAFLLFWFLSLYVGSRNWLFLGAGVSDSLVWRLVVVACFCACCSFPVSLQFFAELKMLGYSACYSGCLFFFMCFYLFFGGLVPFINLGCLLVRRGVGVSLSFLSFSGPLLILLFLLILEFGCFVFV